MEFLVVSSSKLKIMMSFEDMKRFEIDGDNIDYDDPKVRRSFWKILDEARDKCGFQTSGDKILIQFYPSKEGSEIFVTKLGLISSGAERTIAKSSKVAMLSTKLLLYRFSTLNALLSAIKIIDRSDCEKTPTAYFDPRGNYYLIVEVRQCSTNRLDASPLVEYGTELPSNISAYVTEHATKLDFDALMKL